MLGQPRFTERVVGSAAFASLFTDEAGASVASTTTSVVLDYFMTGVAVGASVQKLYLSVHKRDCLMDFPIDAGACSFSLRDVSPIAGIESRLVLDFQGLMQKPQYFPVVAVSVVTTDA